MEDLVKVAVILASSRWPVHSDYEKGLEEIGCLRERGTPHQGTLTATVLGILMEMTGP